MKEQIEKFLKKIVKGELQFFDFETPSPYRKFKKYGISYAGDFFYSIHEKEKECEPEGFYPHNLLPSIKVTAEHYNIYIYNICNGIDLVVETNKGNISGVGYGKGWEMKVGIHYHGVMIKIYHYKTSNNLYDISGVLYEEFYKWIDFSKFEKVDNYNNCFSNYSMFYSHKENPNDFLKLLELFQEGDSFYYYDTFIHIMNHNDKLEKEVNKVFKNLSFTKFIVCDEYKGNLELPESCVEITFDIRENDKNPKSIHQYRKSGESKKYSIENLSKYKNLFQDKKNIVEAEKIKKYRVMQEKAATAMKIEFDYKGLAGVIFTNVFSYEKMLKYYKKKEIVEINVLDKKVNLDFNDFKKTITTKKILKNKKIFEKASAYLGNVGVIGWWKKEFDDLREIYNYY